MLGIKKGILFGVNWEMKMEILLEIKEGMSIVVLVKINKEIKVGI